MEKGELQVVDGLKCCGRRVVNGTRGCFKDGEDVSFELVDECSMVSNAFLKSMAATQSGSCHSCERS